MADLVTEVVVQSRTIAVRERFMNSMKSWPKPRVRRLEAPSHLRRSTR